MVADPRYPCLLPGLSELWDGQLYSLPEPYYWPWTPSNQLPYIDEIQVEIVGRADRILTARRASTTPLSASAVVPMKSRSCLRMPSPGNITSWRTT